jgi:phenylalanyl-tRNA synthetase beta chain
MFSIYCQKPFTVEAVEIHNQSKERLITPNINQRVFETNINYLNKLASTNLQVNEIAKYLERMSLKCEIAGQNELRVHAPITRSDILHACDIAEDLAISFGYNNISKQPARTLCHGSQQSINKLTDLIRLEFAQAEYIECLTMALISKKDNFFNMNKEETQCVQIMESKVTEFEIFRTSLLPCLLKTIEANKAVQVDFPLN